MIDSAVAVVTGAASGIGAGISRELVRRGYSVVVTDVQESAAASLAQEIGSSHRQLDVVDDVAVDAVVRSVADQFGRLDAWINNAGISAMSPFLNIPISQLDRVLAINLRAVFICAQSAAREMVRLGQPGRIVNIASMAGKQGRVPYLADYVASKFGVVGLTQSIAYELAQYGITVNSVCPGYVSTDMQARELEWEAQLRNVSPSDVRRMWIEDTPLGRLEMPLDVARAVAFLLSEDASFMTGEALAVNGGAFMD